MCGIVGLYLKNPNLYEKLGEHLQTMLVGMTERGPDSAGFAVYGDQLSAGLVKLTLYDPAQATNWDGLAHRLQDDLNATAEVTARASHAVLIADTTHDAVANWLRTYAPAIRVMSHGDRIEIYKDMGLPVDVANRFGLAAMVGSHGIGHTRMATESAVTTEHSHPFIAGADLCLVHNGSLSNYNRLRAWLSRRGRIFATDNDSEVAAQYFAFRLGQGLPLSEALRAGLRDLDGFYTFAVGTRDGFAVLRDGIACKPAVLAENDDWVAMASEFRSLSALPGIDRARVWEPAPAVVYSWEAERMDRAA
ncbi:MAG: glutamine amidotransferase family protein [Alphaproteobacteria bacterium]|nr:glutamine amidotransferase family protein [Alphaproteobacteria bacterium]